MKILVAPDKFKGTLSALQVCDAVERGLLHFEEHIKVVKVPLADGGEGSLDALQPYLNLQSVSIPVRDPLGRTITASYKISKDAGYIEMAAASGLDLLSESERDCMVASSYGTGQMIADASERGLSKVFLFVGGSATCDGGLGILAALGIRALGEEGVLPPTGASLVKLEGFDASSKINDMSITVVCDVLNPLYGPQGAAQVYAPQKGADAESVELLDQGLMNLATVVKTTRDIIIDDFLGAGAAGGVAAGLKAFYPLEVKPGFNTISEMVGLRNQIEEAELVITGEGKLDHQTLQGKVVKGVYDLCLSYNKPLLVICGVLDLSQQILSQVHFAGIKPLVRKGTGFAQARSNAAHLIGQRALEFLNEWH